MFIHSPALHTTASPFFKGFPREVGRSGRNVNALPGRGNIRERTGNDAGSCYSRGALFFALQRIKKYAEVVLAFGQAKTENGPDNCREKKYRINAHAGPSTGLEDRCGEESAQFRLR
jgi:hypothetical protein